MEKIACADAHWRVHVRWRQSLVEIVAPEERFPQLKLVEVGVTIRCLDMRLHGLRHSLKVRLSEMSEIFVLDNPPVSDQGVEQQGAEQAED